MPDYIAVTLTVTPWTGSFSAGELAEIADVANGCGGDVDVETSTHEAVKVKVPDTMADECAARLQSLDNIGDVE